MFTIHKYQRQSGSFKERLIVKAYRSKEAMYTFLNAQYDNTWIEHKPGLPEKAGTYAYAGGQWHNVRSLDISLLAHI